MQGDELLLRRACKGDVQAFEELMQSHESRIYAIALRMMGNREDAQDCAQEAMVRIYRAMGSFKGQSALATWIYRITMNTCLDELRRRKARKVTSLDSLVDNGWSPTDTGDTPEEHGLRVEKQNALNQAIQRRFFPACAGGRLGLWERAHQIPMQIVAIPKGTPHAGMLKIQA